MGPPKLQVARGKPKVKLPWNEPSSQRFYGWQRQHRQKLRHGHNSCTGLCIEWI